MILRFAACLFLNLSALSAQVYTTFSVSRDRSNPNQVEEFTVEMDHINTSITVANFLMLSGLEDQYWANPRVSPLGNYQFRPRGLENLVRPIVDLSERPTMNIAALQNSPDLRVAVANQGVIIGATDRGIRLKYKNNNLYEDETGNFSIYRGRDPLAPRDAWILKLTHPKAWLNTETGEIEETIPYSYTNPSASQRNLLSQAGFVAKEEGKRLFGGSLSNSPLEHPGYRIADELTPLTGSSLTDPFLRKFQAPYTLAMDSQGPNTSGSRYFFTVSREKTVFNPNAGETAEDLDQWTGNFTPFGTIPKVWEQQRLRALMELDPEQLVIRSIRTAFKGQAGTLYWPHLIDQASINSPRQFTPVDLQINGSSSNHLDFSTTLSEHHDCFLQSSSDLNFRSVIPVRIGSHFGSDPGELSYRQEINPAAPRRFFRAYRVPLMGWPSHEALPSVEGLRIRFQELNERALGAGQPFELRFTRDADPTDDTPAIHQLIAAGTVTPFTLEAYDTESDPVAASIIPQGLTEAQAPVDASRIVLHFDRAFQTFVGGIGSAGRGIRRYTLYPADPEAAPSTGVWQIIE